MTDKRGCPVRDKILVEKTNPATTRCPVRDNMCVEHIAYLTARPFLRGYLISTNISSLRDAVPQRTQMRILFCLHFLLEQRRAKTLNSN